MLKNKQKLPLKWTKLARETNYRRYQGQVDTAVQEYIGMNGVVKGHKQEGNAKEGQDECEWGLHKQLGKLTDKHK